MLLLAIRLEQDTPLHRRALGQLLYRAMMPGIRFVSEITSADVVLWWGSSQPVGKLTVPLLSLPDGGFIEDHAAWQRGIPALVEHTRRARTMDELRQSLFRHENGGATAVLDLCSLCLGLLDQWEDRLIEDRDEHGRFPATEGVLFRESALLVPVVDRVARALGEELSRLGGHRAQPDERTVLRGHPFVFCPSLDIDSDGMFRGRTALRTLRQGAREGTETLAKAVAAGVATKLHITDDPHLRLREIAEALDGADAPSTFFVQTHRAHALDSYELTADSPLLKELLRISAGRNEVGLHSSFSTRSGDPSIEEQWTRLRTHLLRARSVHRAHFLRVEVNDLWRDDAELADSSIGFSGATGFRLGTAVPFPLLQRNGQDDGAWEVPPSAMDVTLRYREGLTPELAANRVAQLFDAAEEVGGCVSIIWHPNNMEELFWPGWRGVFFDLIAEAHRRGALVTTISNAAMRYASHHAATMDGLREALG